MTKDREIEIMDEIAKLVDERDSLTGPVHARDDDDDEIDEVDEEGELIVNPHEARLTEISGLIGKLGQELQALRYVPPKPFDPTTIPKIPFGLP